MFDAKAACCKPRPTCYGDRDPSLLTPQLGPASSAKSASFASSFTGSVSSFTGSGSLLTALQQTGPFFPAHVEPGENQQGLHQLNGEDGLLNAWYLYIYIV